VFADISSPVTVSAYAEAVSEVADTWYYVEGYIADDARDLVIDPATIQTDTTQPTTVEYDAGEDKTYYRWIVGFFDVSESAWSQWLLGSIYTLPPTIRDGSADGQVVYWDDTAERWIPSAAGWDEAKQQALVADLGNPEWWDTVDIDLLGPSLMTTVWAMNAGG
jgi:hypothetical protein